MWAFLLNPYKPPVRPPESAWCSQCACWRTFDTIPAIPDSGVPPFTICGWCGAGIDYEETA
jgi:hypothetical protein